MSETLWTAAAAAAATGGRATSPWTATGVSIDSRTVRPGELFVAIRGPRADGHDHVRQALTRGATAAMVSRLPDPDMAVAPLLFVDDTQAGLAALGAAGRARAAATVIAVTGSVGKTTTKEMLREALSGQGATAASPASFNNHWGVPLSLANLPPTARFGVFEIGMNRTGEIRPLARMARPHVAVVTTVEAVHLEFFATVAEIADAKAEVFEGLEPGGVAVINVDNPFHAQLKQRARAAGVGRFICFGAHPSAAVRLLSAEADDAGSVVTAEAFGRRLRYRLALSGRHAAQDSLAALAAVHAAGGDVAAAAACLEALAPLPGRGRRHRIAVVGGTAELIDESYNASPAAVRAVVEALTATPVAGRRIAVLGDMLELGAGTRQQHTALAEVLAERGVDLVFTVGPQMAHLFAALPPALQGAHANDATDLIPVLNAQLRAGDRVVVKGSRGIRLERIVAALLPVPSLPKAANG